MDKDRSGFVEKKIKELEGRIRSFKTTSEFLDFITAMSRFHNYSFHNQALILCQRPQATKVAGFVTWKNLGRHVKKGEKGIVILVPIIHRKESKEMGEKESEIVRRFKTGHVFDISQTEGVSLPEIRLDVDDMGDSFYNACLELARLEGVTVKVVDDMRAYGLSQNGQVLLREEDNKTSMASTFLHELAHERLHWDDDGRRLDRESKELEAEAVAYLVCSRFGIELPSYKYLASWQRNHSIMESLRRISECSQKIIQRLEIILSSAENSVEALI